MQINLKKAAALASVLAGSQVKFDHAFAVDVFADAPTEDTVERAREALKQQVSLALGLADAAFLIRSLIGRANVGHINDLLTQRALVDKQLQLVNGIPLRQRGTDLVALTRQIEAKRAGGNEAQGYQLALRGGQLALRGGGLTLDLETESIVSPLLKNLRRMKRNIDDELQAVNFNTQIEIPANVVRVLTDLDLV